jgi:pilus assembly protein CpaE
MKIAVISPNLQSLQEIGRTLSAHTLTLEEGGKSKMRSVAEREQPDLMLVEGMCCDADDLGQVEFVTTHFSSVSVILLCPTHTPEFLINAMRAGVREVLPSPVSSVALEAAVNRIGAKLVSSQPAGQGKILAFMPCKGGSGATFLATNLGYQLAETKTVLLIDLNLQFGDALSFVHDGKPASTLADVARDIAQLQHSGRARGSFRSAANQARAYRRHP